MKRYYAGIGSRETPINVMETMRNIAIILERQGLVLRSGGANGADDAFEKGVSNPDNKDIYLPYPEFNGRSSKKSPFIYIPFGDDDFDKAYESLIHHPSKGKMGASAKNMMLRNYFQIYGIRNQPKSEFVICWTPDAANGTTIKTTYDTGGSGQCIRLAAINNIPVYNLEDKRYKHMDQRDILNLILYNLENEINPDSQDNINFNTTSFF